MNSPQITLRIAPDVYEEILRLAKAHKKSQAEVTRMLVYEALANRAEELTATQFQFVEQRLANIERRFSGWMVKLARAIAESLFYSEQLATFDLNEDEKRMVNTTAEKFVRRFMQIKHEDPARPSRDAGIE